MDKRKPTAHVDWRNAQAKLDGLSVEAQTILERLIAGRTQPEIGKELGLHRSAVWRRVNKLKERLVDQE